MQFWSNQDCPCQICTKLNNRGSTPMNACVCKSWQRMERLQWIDRLRKDTMGLSILFLWDMPMFKKIPDQIKCPMAMECPMCMLLLQLSKQSLAKSIHLRCWMCVARTKTIATDSLRKHIWFESKAVAFITWMMSNASIAPHPHVKALCIFFGKLARPLPA